MHKFENCITESETMIEICPSIYHTRLFKTPNMNFLLTPTPFPSPRLKKYMKVTELYQNKKKSSSSWRLAENSTARGREWTCILDHIPTGEQCR